MARKEKHNKKHNFVKEENSGLIWRATTDKTFRLKIVNDPVGLLQVVQFKISFNVLGPQYLCIGTLSVTV